MMRRRRHWLAQPFGHPPQCSIKSSNPTPQSLNKKKIIIQGRPKVGQSVMKESTKANKKRVMETLQSSHLRD